MQIDFIKKVNNTFPTVYFFEISLVRFNDFDVLKNLEQLQEIISEFLEKITVFRAEFNVFNEYDEH